MPKAFGRISDEIQTMAMRAWCEHTNVTGVKPRTLVKQSAIYGRTRVAEHGQKLQDSAIRDYSLGCNKQSTPIRINEFEAVKIL